MLKRRIISAAILAPVTLAMVLAGGAWLHGVALVAAAAMGWEWARLCTGRDTGVPMAAVVGTTVLGMVAGAIYGMDVGLLVLVVGGIACLLLALAAQRPTPVFLGFGPVVAGAPCLAFVWLAMEPARGVINVLWLLGVVWASDIGAYAAGRSLGGPKLAPRISPNKTWSGSIGGIIAAGLVGGLAAGLTNAANGAVMVLVSGGLAIVAQIGDLAESAAKRRFGVKDTSNLIPGHGGVLDRLDSLLTAAPTLAVLTSIGGSVLTWK